ncbi:MAG: phosphatidylglycerophosphatase A [Candidatus Omnitrophica bacterium]|nr:phosphatidylglycerophosphatase A [Candidatus Omnitrophota bacterium]
MVYLNRTFIKTVATFFYIGYFPYMPGTFASLVGMVLYYFIKDEPFIYGLVTLFLIALGFLAIGKAEELFKDKDPACIVIDEVSSLLLVFLFIPYSVKWAILGFLLFRLFDALKPYPIYRFQYLKGSLGVMCDDIVAAIYANITLQFIFRLASFITS